MIEKLLPAPISTAESFADDPVSEMYPEEFELVANAVPNRQREFGTVRNCARRALGAFGIDPAPVLPGPGRAPRWPDGIVGAMTHCTGYRGAAVARARDVRSLGVDAEPHAPIEDPGVVDLVTLPEERAQIAQLAVHQPEICWARLIFSAKESVYKAWYPLTGRWLGFEDARLTLDPTDATFTARLLVPGPVVDGHRLDTFSGRWLIGAGLVMTAVTVPGTA
ncbi:4'-phosphopantetheinyl transferase superfamily protein [Streptomyces sp. MspMP-M5]|uniref:4'-phosphopantetheinyl transferase family protein n=1 Tax=unclassified Streptomyces TaxID=2593676 RepID=UPI00035DAFBB|nr:4'-phosphopantetheinyl transferase superfamily protein [Streptomyces sp. MspMP-M5]MYT28067.1 4'-phosphopantetheinyl transferase superfamily protein [Streptomyces sp. SID8354]